MALYKEYGCWFPKEGRENYIEWWIQTDKEDCVSLEANLLEASPQEREKARVNKEEWLALALKNRGLTPACYFYFCHEEERPVIRVVFTSTDEHFPDTKSRKRVLDAVIDLVVEH